MAIFEVKSIAEDDSFIDDESTAGSRRFPTSEKGRTRRCTY